jgi:hypothetical protein
VPQLRALARTPSRMIAPAAGSAPLPRPRHRGPPRTCGVGRPSGAGAAPAGAGPRPPSGDEDACRRRGPRRLSRDRARTWGCRGFSRQRPQVEQQELLDRRVAGVAQALRSRRVTQQVPAETSDTGAGTEADGQLLYGGVRDWCAVELAEQGATVRVDGGQPPRSGSGPVALRPALAALASPTDSMWHSAVGDGMCRRFPGLGAGQSAGHRRVAASVKPVAPSTTWAHSA